MQCRATYWLRQAQRAHARRPETYIRVRETWKMWLVRAVISTRNGNLDNPLDYTAAVVVAAVAAVVAVVVVVVVAAAAVVAVAVEQRTPIFIGDILLGISVGSVLQ